MIDSRRHNHQVSPLQPDSDPRIFLSPHIKVAATTQYVSDLLVLVQMLVEERLDFLLVARQQIGRYLNLIAVFVGALGGDAVHAIEIIGKLVVFDA
jgi:hypothetical protein